MKKILFYGDECRELIGLLPVMKELGKIGVLFYFSSMYEITRLKAHQLRIPITDNLENFDILIVTKMHCDFASVISKYYYSNNRVVLLIQHAFDYDLHLISEKLGLDIDNFTKICCGDYFAYKKLISKFGKDKVILTGIPRLDDLYEVYTNSNYKEIYELLGLSEYWLITIPEPHIANKTTLENYFIELPRFLNAPPVYKVHPRSNSDFYSKYNEHNHIIIDDDTLPNRIDLTYKLLCGSKGLVSYIPPSFYAFEASFIKKPVILYGEGIKDKKIEELYKDINHIFYRYKNISSSFSDPEFNETQQKLCEEFLFDGKNSQRVVDVIKEYL